MLRQLKFGAGGQTMEVRPIDANALIKELTEKGWIKDDITKDPVEVTAIRSAIDAAPTLDDKPVVHAHWKMKIVKSGYWYECSNCGSHWTINGETHECEQTPYCYNCGAKMDEEVK